MCGSIKVECGRETGEARAWWRKAWGECWFAAPLRRKGYGLCVLLCSLVSGLTCFRSATEGKFEKFALPGLCFLLCCVKWGVSTERKHTALVCPALNTLSYLDPQQTLSYLWTHIFSAPVLSPCPLALLLSLIFGCDHFWPDQRLPPKCTEPI